MFPYTHSSSSTTTTATTTSTLEGAFLHFPWPFLDDVDEYDMLCQEHQNLVMNNSHLPSNEAKADVPSSEANMIMSNGGGAPFKGLVEIQGKRTGKNDRHSKIRTAHGLRDRRMRLSVKVARKFFDLQDMLDFDKASKTIEWLLKNSEPAIQELLARNNKCMSSSDSPSEEVTNKEMEVMQITEEPLVGTKPREKRKRRRCCKTAPVNPLTREIRDKARARARERTRERLTMLETSKHRLEAGGDSAAAPNQNLEFPSRHAMKSKRSLGNVQEQNIENEVFSTNPNCQEHSSTPHPSSIFITNSNGEQWNPSSVFGTSPNTQADQNPIPNSIFMNINALELGIPSQYSQLSIPYSWETIFCNPILK